MWDVPHRRGRGIRLGGVESGQWSGGGGRAWAMPMNAADVVYWAGVREFARKVKEFAMEKAFTHGRMGDAHVPVGDVCAQREEDVGRPSRPARAGGARRPRRAQGPPTAGRLGRPPSPPVLSGTAATGRDAKYRNEYY